ncbi:MULTISPECIES: HIT domain-containing protein [unclassified Microbacterium]|jgi:histidine triad (HIT) family protein|uniref:HIT domain-containing protein n=1 Tax=unclassified Microbacterium TaxID=2609290 RepID=UPI000CFDEE29|nr:MULTISPECIES: HIT domain-containing protein [unclassified Microbacterium]PRB11362.1 histidine triad nucleotide-binding protein [Microbacterium sp. MYb72]
MSEPSIFTRILTGDIPGEILLETDRVFAIRDINPQAPLHALVIPKTEEYRDVTELAAGDPALLADIVAAARRLAEEHANGEYRLIFNNGASAGQSVFHVHAHVLGNIEESKLVGF